MIALAALAANPWVAVPLGIAKSVGRFLRSLPWQVWLAAGLLLVGWRYGEHRYDAGKADQKATDKAVIDTLNQRIVAQRESLGDLRDKLKKQNEAIDRLKAGGEAGEAQAATAATTVLLNGKERRQRIERDPNTGPEAMNQWMTDLFSEKRP